LEGLIKDILDMTEYEEYLKETEEDADDRIENVQEFVNKIIAYEAEHDQPTLGQFLEEVALVAEIDNVKEDTDRVLLMTLHSAKGLEFPYVYLAGMEDGVFPSYMTITSDDRDDLEEERRLAYVGITRAMKDLTLTCAKSRMLHGQTQYNMVSRFVKEIPTELLDQKMPKKRFSEEEIASAHTQAILQRPVYDYRPKATLKPKETAPAVKPYISQSINDLNSIAGISKGITSAKNGLEYGVGDRVQHIKFGAGTVKGIQEEPRDYKVTVEFDNSGQKIMYASFAKLKKI
jgi:DNA helicase-2/ATP-dependent DNA helicase PcrA